MKTFISCLLLVSILFGITACSSDTAQSTSNTSIEIVCDINQYANISSQKLIELLGEPDDISYSTPATGFVEIPCVYYDYYNTEELGEVSFLLINDTVAKFTAYSEFPLYKKKNDLLTSLNIKKSDNCVMVVDTETALRFRCLTDSIDDLWITNISGDTYGFMSVTYDMMYFEEWYLPMSVSEQSNYQYWTQEYVKDLLKSPKSADFPNINNWAIVKNNFYTIAQSYVDAINSFGAEIRSEFTFIYPIESSTPIYVVIDGEIIVDNGYIPTEDLIKKLVSNSTVQTQTQSITQEKTNESSELFEDTDAEPITTTPDTTSTKESETTPPTKPEPTPTTTPEPAQTTKPEPVPTTTPEPAQTTKSEPAPTTTPEPAPTTTPEPAQTTKPEPAPTTKPEPVPTTTPVPAPTTTPVPAPTTTPVPDTTEPIQETNSISDLEYVVYNVCEKYNSGNTAYNGQLYATVNSATSVTIEHYIRDLVPISEEHILYQMEEALLQVFSDTLSEGFPESIEITIYTTATIIEDSIEPIEWSSEWISDTDLTSLYNLTVLWLDTEILVMPEGIAVTSYQIVVNKEDLRTSGACDGNYNEIRISLMYDGTLYFYYDDLVIAGII